MDFNTWLLAFHPTVRLLPWQQEWIDLVQDAQYSEASSMQVKHTASGKTFVTSLWAEYQEYKQKS